MVGIRPQGRAGREGHTGTRFTCFTGTKVLVLTPEELLQGFQQSQARYGRSVNGGYVRASVGGV